ncbi:MAG: hypothetical protein AAF961_17335, partial [Planctomycetota bacterium]
MALNPYAPCPCGNGKKLKFCCADLADEIEKIQALIASDQRQAALMRVERLLQKHPDRAPLLDICATLHFFREDFEAAGEIVARLLADHADNPLTHGHAAILAAAREQPLKGVAALQSALECADQQIPHRVLEAIGAVGGALLRQGNVVAARAHLLMYAGFSGDKGNQAIELLLKMNLQSGLPLLLRDQLTLAKAPAEAPWQDAFDAAVREASKGLWRRAESHFAEIQDGTPPAVVYNLALLRGWLGDTQAMADSLHAYARLDVPWQRAEEAKALAELIDPSLNEPTLATVRLCYPIADIDELTSRLAGDKRVESYEFDASEFDDDQDPPPRSSYLLLDRPVPVSGVNLTVDEAPNVLAFMSLFGKRTDREARLEVTTDRGELFEFVGRLIEEIGSGGIGGESSCET